MHTPLLLTEELSKRIKFEDASIKDAMTRGEQSAMAKYKERVNYDPLWAPGLFVNDFPTLVGHLGPALWKRWIVFPTQARYIDTDDPTTLGPGEFPMDDELSARIEADPIPVYQALWAWLMRGHIILREHNGSLLRSHFPWPAEVASATAAWRAQYDNALGQFYSLWLDFDDPKDEIKQRRPSRSTHAEVMKAIVKWTGDETGKGTRGEEFAWSAERVKERMLNDPDLAARGAAWAKGRVPSTDKDAPKSPIWCWKGFTVREHPAVLTASEIEFEGEGDENERPLVEVMGVEDDPF